MKQRSINIPKRISFYYPLILTLLLLTLSVLLIAPWGEFAVNDDWAYARQVEAFTKGNFKVSSFLTASFILQGLIGLVWSSILGFSLTNLRILTILNTFFIIFAAYLILKELKVNRRTAFIALLLIAFNPLIYTSSMTFMSDNYFLTFILWSVYFFIRYLHRKQLFDIILASAVCALSILVRQIGIVLPIAFTISLLLKNYQVINNFQNRKKLTLPIFISFTGPLLAFIALSFWERYPGPDYSTNLSTFLNMLPRILFSFWYFTFFVSPLVLTSKQNTTKKLKGVYWTSVLLFSYFIFRMDLFPVGNVLSVEGLYIKSEFKSILSIFNNIFFKAFLSLIIGISFIKFINIIYTNRHTIIRKLPAFDTPIFLLMSILGLFFIIFLGNDFYDRHLIPSITLFIILAAYAIPQNKDYSKYLSTLVLLTIVLLSTFLEHDFIQKTKLMWKQAYDIQSKTIYITQIRVDAVYSKYFNAKKNNDYTGAIVREAGGDPVCYVQQYSIDTGTTYNKLWTDLIEKVEDYIDNPKVYRNTKPSMSRIKKNLDKLWVNEEYFSPMYFLTGKKTFVGSWCSEKE